MTLNVMRAVFVLLMVAVGYSFAMAEVDQTWPQFLQDHKWLGMVLALAFAVGMICVDALSGRRKLAIFSGVALGIVVGLVVTYGLSFAVTLAVDNLLLPATADEPPNRAVITFLNLLIGTISVYLAVSFVLQTRDDFRFIIPYVEFRRGAKGSRPIVVDTSALIDGRIADVATTGVFDGQLIIPQFVVHELQHIADSADRLKRARGRRGLDVLARLKRDPRLDVRIYDDHADGPQAGSERPLPVDQRLVNLAIELDGRALTIDFNLNKVAQLSGVEVINLNDLANALKPEVLPGETMRVEIVRPGSGEDQGIGYLDDGTMVVVEHGRDRLNDEVEVVVTNTTQTSAGRMIFGRASGSVDAEVAQVSAPAPSSASAGAGRRRGQRQEQPASPG